MLNNKSIFVFSDDIERRFKLLYKGTIHGFKGKVAHKKIDGSGAPTICFAVSGPGKVFGGYVSKDWGRTFTGYKGDKNAFIFSLSHQTKHPLKD